MLDMPCKIDDGVSNKLANMGFVCACLVICLHVCPSLEVGSGGWWVYRILAGSGLASVAVPMFFCISGFLFAGRMSERGWYARQVTTRMRSLLLPYVFWNLLHWGVMLLLAWIALKVGTNFGSADLTDITWQRMVRVLGLNPIAFPEYPFLWFLRCLLTMVVLSPLFAVLRSDAKLGGGVIFMLFIIKTVIPRFLPEFGSWIPGFNINGWTSALFYFPVGIFLRYHPISFSGRGRMVLLAACGLLWGLIFAFRQEGLFDVFCLTGCVLMVELTPCKLWPKSLTSCAFPVFLLHGFVLIFFPPVIKWFPILGCSFCGYFFQVVCVFGICLMLICLLRKFMPRFASIVFGGRGV